MTEQSQNEDVRPRSRRIPVYGIAVLFALAIMLALAFLPPSNLNTRYPFIQADHPIDVGSSGSGRWFYFMPANVEKKTPADLADTARRYLIPRGYKEDTSSSPWFRFANGEHEVIVCNHDEIATAPRSLLGWQVFHQPGFPAGQRQNWPVIWVREPGQNSAGILWFKFQKLVRRW